MTSAVGRTVLDPVLEAGNLMGAALEMNVRQAIHRAQVCGCGDCRAAALETVAWAERLLGARAGDD